VAELREKQKRFVEEYMIDLNATQAAIRAGYSVKSASDLGAQLLRKPRVAAAVARARAEQAKRTGIEADRVLRELAKLAFVNAADVIDDADGTIKATASRDDTAAVCSVKVKTIPTDDGEIVEREVRLNDKNKALDALCKHLGLYDATKKQDGAESRGGIVEIPAVLPSKETPHE
jgi:phage terminase small subunit